MKMVCAIIKPFKLDDVREALADLHFFAILDLDLFELLVSPDSRIVVAEQRPQIAILRFTNGDDSYAHARIYGKTKPSSAC